MPATYRYTAVAELYCLSQGNDPSTDFRGAGYLALDNLIYFAENHQKEFHDLMTKV